MFLPVSMLSVSADMQLSHMSNKRERFPTADLMLNYRIEPDSFY